MSLKTFQLLTIKNIMNFEINILFLSIFLFYIWIWSKIYNVYNNLCRITKLKKYNEIIKNNIKKIKLNIKNMNYKNKSNEFLIQCKSN